jgi:uncharacterized membrane protein
LLERECRLVKEVASYKAEAAMLLERVEKMDKAGEDEYEVRQQVRLSGLELAGCALMLARATAKSPRRLSDDDS